MEAELDFIPKFLSPVQLIRVWLMSTSSRGVFLNFRKSQLNFPLLSAWNHSDWPTNLRSDETQIPSALHHSRTRTRPNQELHINPVDKPQQTALRSITIQEESNTGKGKRKKEENLTELLPQALRYSTLLLCLSHKTFQCSHNTCNKIQVETRLFQEFKSL